jgi:hypothetical protein
MSRRTVNVSARAGKEDCSGVISAIAFGIFCVLGSLFLFYLISGPATFLEVVTMSPGDTIFHDTTWSRMWCGCIQLGSTHNVTATEVALYRFPADAKLPLTVPLSYQVTQNVSNAVLEFEYWEAYFHPGANATACFEFSEPVTFYFAQRYYVDGADHDPDYQDHFNMTFANLTSGCVTVGNFTVSGGWAFVWEKQFKLQEQTRGLVQYSFEMLEYAIPAVNSSDKLEGEGRFCWDNGAPADAWLLAAKEGRPVDPDNKRLGAELWCIPRYALSIPITAIPVVIAATLEILIIIFCICKPHRAAQRSQRYEQI